MNAVSKFRMDEMKFSLLRMDRMVFQSGMISLSAVASKSKQMDSSASFTIAGGLAIDLISDNCFFFIPLTADGFVFRFRGTHTKTNPKRKWSKKFD